MQRLPVWEIPLTKTEQYSFDIIKRYFKIGEKFTVKELHQRSGVMNIYWKTLNTLHQYGILGWLWNENEFFLTEEGIKHE